MWEGHESHKVSGKICRCKKLMRSEQALDQAENDVREDQDGKKDGL